MKKTWIAAIALMGLVACNGGESTDNAADATDVQTEATMNEEGTEEAAPMEAEETEETESATEMEEPAADASSSTEAPAEESTAGEGAHLTSASKGGAPGHETIQKEVETETEALSTEGSRQMQQTETAVRK